MELTAQKKENIKPGYKVTEVGVIPEDWKAYSLSEITTPSKQRFNPQTSNLSYPCIELEHIGQDTGRLIGLVDSEKQLSQKCVFKKEDVLFSKLRPYLKKYYYADFDGVCSTEIWVLRPNSILLNRYLFYLVQTNTFLEATYLSTGTKMPRAEWKVVKELNIPVPSNIKEQQAIATALSDVDNLITSLDRLIAKKKAIKQGAMQELLIEKKQLPGFHGKWVEKNLGSTSMLKARIGWQGLTTAEYLTQGDYFLVTGTDFKNNSIDWNNCHYVSRDRYIQDPYIQVQSKDVLVTKDGTIGKIAFVRKRPKPATLNSGVFVIRPINKAYDPEYLFYILSSKYFDDFLKKLSAGSTISHLYQKDFVHFSFPAPLDTEEQKAIAAILGDMDTEIETLETRRDKTKALKQGMMQQLLTGKIRLI